MDATTTDRLAIGDLLETYAAALDDGEVDALRAVFTSDAHVDYTSAGGPAGDVGELVSWLEATFYAQIAASQHHITNRRIDVRGDEATSRSYLLNPIIPREGRPALVAGTYHDRLVRTGDGWRIADRRFDLVWSR